MPLPEKLESDENKKRLTIYFAGIKICIYLNTKPVTWRYVWKCAVQRVGDDENPAASSLQMGH